MQSNCLFCQMVRGEKPVYMIYEDSHFMAMLDIFPYGPGHVLVIPKEHYRWVWDVPNIGEYMETAQKIGLHLSQKMGTETVYSFIFGEQVPHAHIHLVPPLFKVQRQERINLSDNEAVELQEKLLLSK